MNVYAKKIRVTDTGVVVGEVFAPDGRRVGVKLFAGWANLHAWPWAVAQNCEDAHKWADRMLQVCAEGEVLR